MGKGRGGGQQMWIKKFRIQAKLCPLICVIQKYRFYTMSPSPYHGCCKYQESMGIPRVHVYTMSPCLYHDSLPIKGLYKESQANTMDVVNTMSPCLY